MSRPVQQNEIIISVVIITYNQEQYIDQCLESVVTQKVNARLDIVLGEDCSSDKTRERCLAWKDRYPDMINLRLQDPENVVYVNGRRTGRYNLFDCLAQCRGQFIAVCEGDDYWSDPGKLQKQLDVFLSDPGVAVVHTGMQTLYMEDGKKVPYHKEPPPERATLNDLLRGTNFVGTASMMLRADHRKYPDYIWKLPYTDFFFQLWYGRKGDIVFLGEVMAVYRVHAGGAHSQLFQNPMGSYRAAFMRFAFWQILFLHDREIGRAAEPNVLKFGRAYIHSAGQIGKRKDQWKYSWFLFRNCREFTFREWVRNAMNALFRSGKAK